MVIRGCLLLIILYDYDGFKGTGEKILMRKKEC